MTASTTVVPVPQLVDLALSTPEVGIVNFTILHSLLHVIINQLDLTNCKVEFRGGDSERLQNYLQSAKLGPSITLTEYSLDAEGKEKKRRGSKDAPPKDASKPKSSKDNIKKGGSQTIVVIEPPDKGTNEPPQVNLALKKEQFDQLFDQMKKLDDKVKELIDLPTNTGLLNILRSSPDQDSKPVLEMFQILNLVKRLDATEASLEKVASMMEDLAKETAFIAQMAPQQGDDQNARRASEGAIAVANQAQELRTSIGSGKSSQLEEIEKRISQLELYVEEIKKSGGLRTSSSLRGSIRSADSQSDTKKKKVTKKKKSKTDVEEDDQKKDKVEALDVTKLSSQEAVAYLQKQLNLLSDQMKDCQDMASKSMKEIEKFKSAMTKDVENLPPDVRIAQVELRFNESLEQLELLNATVGQQFCVVQDKLSEMEKELAAVWEKVNQGISAESEKDKTHNIDDLYAKLVQLQSDMTALSETAQKLLADRERKQGTIDVIIEQIEMLKTEKADREDLEDALADKADACQINRKVSHDQFDAAYDEITKQLTDTLEKLTKQEDLWSQALTDIQKEIGNKLDKMELSPLRDFINSKLKSIQEKFKKISAMKQEHEAAGTKSKYLRNVNCISCDSPVIMKKDVDITLYPKPYAMPPTKSMGPYLAYELDQLRKQQKGVNKNINMFENALSSGRQKQKDKDHLCNRYCGGSHTTTTPQQRVTRIGHFMEQWGPEIVPVEDVLIKGTDGQLYRGNNQAAMKKMADDAAAAAAAGKPADIAIVVTDSKERTLSASALLSKPEEPVGAAPAENPPDMQQGDTIAEAGEVVEAVKETRGTVTKAESATRASQAPPQVLNEQEVRASSTPAPQEKVPSNAALRASAGSVTKQEKVPSVTMASAAEEGAPPDQTPGSATALPAEQPTGSATAVTEEKVPSNAEVAPPEASPAPEEGEPSADA